MGRAATALPPWWLDAADTADNDTATTADKDTAHPAGVAVSARRRSSQRR
jgi:hypothetical protein